MEPGASAARQSGEGADSSCLERLKNSLPGPADLAGAASTLERILRESVCQLQGWLRVYGMKLDLRARTDSQEGLSIMRLHFAKRKKKP